MDAIQLGATATLVVVCAIVWAAILRPGKPRR